MYATHPVEDPARRWQRFCRAGWRMAWMFGALWFGALALLFRVAPAPAPLLHAAPASASWWPVDGGAVLDIRALWSPAVFALPSPAGFSHGLRDERVRLAPPVQAVRPEASFLALPPSPPSLGLSLPGRIRLASPEGQFGTTPSPGVFPPRVPEREIARLVFPAGWESRLFSGIDLNYEAWTNVAWSARIEMRFDGNGVPISMVLAQPSSLPEVDRRLARSAHGWRLLEPEAPRTGMVTWSSPGAAPGAPELPARPAAAGQGAP